MTVAAAELVMEPVRLAEVSATCTACRRELAYTRAIPEPEAEAIYALDSMWNVLIANHIAGCCPRPDEAAINVCIAEVKQ